MGKFIATARRFFRSGDATLAWRRYDLIAFRLGQQSSAELSMTVKESVKQVLESLPDDSTLDDVIHALYIKAKFEHGERQVRQGEGMSDDQAKQRLRKWVG